MKEPPNYMIPRRHVLGSLLISFLFTVPFSTAAQDRNPAADLLPHLDAARLIGQRYLFLAPQERSAARLRHLLFDDNDTSDNRADMLVRLQQIINMKRRHDFSVGNTIILDGWLLARTEARLCALATFA